MSTPHTFWLKQWNQALAAGETCPAPPQTPLPTAQEATQDFLGTLLKRFQFLAADVVLEQALFEAWSTALEAIQAQKEDEAWQSLRLATRRALQDRLPPGQEHPETPCALYKPDLQLRLLGLRASLLQGPIMDLGCGREGALVQYLRQQGWDATGIDPGAAYQEKGVWRTSWMDLSPLPGQWGTVIAHQSFSLHFVYAHLHQNPIARHYAACYRQWLDALKPGGHFAYAPGLPFIEGALPPSRWRVQRRWLDEDTYRDMPEALRRLYGNAGIYSTLITRLA